MAPNSTSTQSHPTVTVVVPTLAAGEALAECLESLERQTFQDFEIVVVDNSGELQMPPCGRLSVVVNFENVGFGAAVNQGIGGSAAPFIAALNDDATVDPHWLEALVAAMESRPDVGMCASRIYLASDGRLDSAGMLLGMDGSSKQRGHLESPSSYARPEEALLPSGCAAFYRREMLEEIGLFDESFFLYCEDTDLGLRARWAAWECLYVPDAKVRPSILAFGGKRLCVESLLCGTQPPDARGEEPADRNAGARAVLFAVAIFLACGVCAHRAGKSCGIP